KHSLARIVVEKDIDTIFHMAAILSATGEKDPKYAYDVNMTGLINVLEVARKKRVERVITPSSIAVFGPDAPKNNTP
ncbi:MAG: NAD-dependent epimerase/dehydratase family protein, partial [Calditrichaeota bacterium]|nr:NAD-dependent epimerase/dehydratase family protein [Calditrichota bacterium]